MSMREFYKDMLPNASGRPGVAPQAYRPMAAPSMPLPPFMQSGEPVAFDGVPPEAVGSDILSVNTQGSSMAWGRNQNTLKSLPRSMRPARGPRVRFFDPLSLVYATGFRDRRFSLTYDTLRRTAYQLSLVGSIILTRINQVSSFAQPYRENQQVGFQIRFNDETHQPTEEERQYIVRLEQMIMACGFGENPHSPYPRDDFDCFIKKVTRDSLTFDQMTYEIIPDMSGRPWEFRAVDAATIRLAATYDGYDGKGPRKFRSADFAERWGHEYGDDFEFDGQGVYTVQVIHGRIEGIFTEGDLAFGLRNPRADMWVNGYGFSEIEMCLNTVLRMLWAEEFNARNFRQGSMANGILNFKGDNYSPEQLEAFRRVWRASVVGVENAHRVPIVQIPEGVEFVNVQKGNHEMEYQKWLEYLLKIVSGVYQIDPSEINFDIGKANSMGAPMFETKQEWRIKYSKDKGLRPLLRFLAKSLTKHIIKPLDSRLYLDFVGLDSLSEPDRMQLLTTRTSTYITINEARKEEGLDPIIGGDIVNNPQFMQAQAAAMQAQADQTASAAAGRVNPWAPWATSGENDVEVYGEVPPTPLYLQEGGDEFSPEDPQPPAPPGMPPGMPPDGGMPGM